MGRWPPVRHFRGVSKHPGGAEKPKELVFQLSSQPVRIALARSSNFAMINTDNKKQINSSERLVGILAGIQRAKCDAPGWSIRCGDGCRLHRGGCSKEVWPWRRRRRPRRRKLPARGKRAAASRPARARSPRPPAQPAEHALIL